MEEFEKVMGAFRNLFQNLLDAASSAQGNADASGEVVATLKNQNDSLKAQLVEMEKSLADAEAGAQIVKVDLMPILIKLDAMANKPHATVDLKPLMDMLTVIRAKMASGGGGSDSANWDKLWGNFSVILKDLSAFKAWMKSLPFGDKGGL